MGEDGDDEADATGELERGEASEAAVGTGGFRVIAPP